MATSGRPITSKQLGAIQADYEAGIATKSHIASKHKIDRKTLFRLAKRYTCIYGEGHEKATDLIKKKVTERIVEDESKKLIDYTRKHLKELEDLRIVTRYNVKALVDEIKATKNNVSKTEADRIFTIQKFCKITSETLSIIYRDERLAMGLDAPPPAEEVKNPREVNQLSDNVLLEIVDKGLNSIPEGENKKGQIDFDQLSDKALLKLTYNNNNNDSENQVN